MGCDIHLYAEKRNDVTGEYEVIWEDTTYNRSYGLFGFLANVRNYSAIKPISLPRGLPKDSAVLETFKVENTGYSGYTTLEYDFTDYHSFSWLSIVELESYDYEQIIEDRRCTINNNGGCTCEPGEGILEKLKDFLGEWLFDIIKQCKEVNAERIVFYFDN